LGPEQVGRYAAVYQVCGIPYMLIYMLLTWLVMPVAYQRAKDVSDPRQLRAADRVTQGGIALYVGGVALLEIGYWIIGGWLVGLLTHPKYMIGISTSTVVMVALGRFLSCLGLLVQLVFAVHQKMTNSLVFRVIGAALTVPICWLMMRRYELWGAAAG